MTNDPPIAAAPSAAKSTVRGSNVARVFLRILLVLSAIVFSLAFGVLLRPSYKSIPLIVALGSGLFVAAALIGLRKKLRTRNIVACVAFTGLLCLVSPLTTLWLVPYDSWYETEIVVNNTSLQIEAALERAQKARATPTTVDDLMRLGFLDPNAYYLSDQHQHSYSRTDYRWTWSFDHDGLFTGSIGIESSTNPEVPACIVSFKHNRGQFLGGRTPDPIRVIGLWPWEPAKLPDSFKPIGADK